MHGIDKIAIFGANGMLGRYVASVLKPYNPTLYTRKEFLIGSDKVADLPEFDLVINCAGIIKQKEGDFYDVNSVFPKQLYERYKLIQISTDCVFQPRGGRGIEEIPDAQDDYGRSKYLGECGMVIRTSIIGNGEKLSLLDWVLSQSEIDGYTDHLWNGVTCLELAYYIRDIIAHMDYMEGVYHYVSNTVTKHDLCKTIAEVYNHPLKINPKAAGECDRTLIGNAAPLTIKDQLIEMANYKINK